MKQLSCDNLPPSPTSLKASFLHLFHLDKYGISDKSGFLSETLPLTRLPSYFEPWEQLLDELPELIKREVYRGKVLALPLLITDELIDLPSKQRAFMVLTFLSSAYIWGHHLTQSLLHVLPHQLAKPLAHMAAVLGLRPITCYTSVSLFNFRVSQLSTLEDLHALHGFSGSDDESWFYMLPLAIEIVSTPCIYAILDCFDALHRNQPQRMATALGTMDTALARVLALLPQMRQKCDPEYFYTYLRPFLSGWSHVPATPEHPHGGVLFEHVHDMPAHWSPVPTLRGQIVKSTGGSAGQTPTIQLLDAFLGIQHVSPMYYDMRDYMPAGFRYFIEDIEAEQDLVRKFVLQAKHPHLLPQFNALIEKMATFRNIHLQLVAQYIVSQKAKSNGAIGCPMSSLADLKGTGNTSLIPFLKETRDETERALLRKPSTNEP